jgi:hypothetical protein
LEREAACGIIELHGGDADIEHDAVNRRETRGRSQPVEFPEAALDQLEAADKLRRQRLTWGKRDRIAVDAEHTSAGCRRQDRL